MTILPVSKNISFRKFKNFLLFASILTALMTLTSCGRKGPPKPPEDFAPEPVLNLNVEGKVSGIKLTWEAPAVDPDKDEEDIKVLAGFVVQKSLYSKDDRGEFDQIGTVLVKGPEETKYSFSDTNVEPGKIYNYQILPFNDDQVNGEPGQTVRVTFLGENSRVERIILESTRIRAPKLNSENQNTNY